MSGKGECLEVVPVEIINYFRVRDFELAVADGAEIDHLPASLKIDLPTTKQVSSSREFSGKWVLEVNV